MRAHRKRRMTPRTHRVGHRALAATQRRDLLFSLPTPILHPAVDDAILNGEARTATLERESTIPRTRAMVADLRNSFRVSFIMSDAPTPIPSALELVTQVQSRPVWDGASISPEGAQFPVVHLDWHEGHGFVLQCYEDEESWSDFLVTSQDFSAPSIEVELGGQALERWPRELFVSAERATQALNHFLQFGKQDPALEWIRLDAFPRETVWDDRMGREAWERANPRTG
jgi:hypothetical protein